MYLAKLSSLPKILENTIPFATVNFRKFKPEFLVEWRAPQNSERVNLILFSHRVSVWNAEFHIW